MHIHVLLARAFVQILRLLLESFFEYLFYDFFSLNLFSHSAHIVAVFYLAVRVLKDNLSVYQKQWVAEVYPLACLNTRFPVGTQIRQCRDCMGQSGREG